MDFQQLINDKFDNFTRSQKKISQYFSEHLQQIAFSTLEELAKQIGVSTTTVIRFARALGYQGYSELQKDIQNSIQNKVSLPERLPSQESETNNILLSDSFQNDIQNIQNTLEIQNNEDLQAAIDMIHSAGNVYVLGMRSSFATSYYMASRLGEIRSNVHLVQSVGMCFIQKKLSAQNRAMYVLLTCFRATPNSVPLILSWMKSEGVKIILITSQNYSPVKGYGDIILPCFISSLSYKNSSAAPLCLSNYLIAALAQKDYSGAQKILQKTGSILSQGYYLGL